MGKNIEVALPLKSHGEMWTVGWDIPDQWAIDENNICWKSYGHGPHLLIVKPNILISSADHNDQSAAERIRKILGKKPKLPDWVSNARRAGWTPPSDWDETKYEE